MKILILTTFNPFKIAGVVALDLYKGLSAINGNEVKVLVKAWDRYPDKNIIPFESRFTHNKNRVFRKFRNLLARFKILKPAYKRTNQDYFVQDYDQTITYYSTKALLKKNDFNPDAIITLFMQNFLSFKNLRELNEITGAPVYLYMMDMAPMTGGCHYAWDCKGYLNNCGNCPALYSNHENDQTRKNWEFKKKYIKETDITAIAGTEWQYRQLMLSSLFRDKPKFKILLGIDGDVFKPGSRLQARNQLKLPVNKKIVFFGALSITSKRKGFSELIESLRIVKDRTNDSLNIHLAIAGYGNIDLEKNLPFDYTLLGYLNHTQLALAFQAADVFVSPSIEDSGPMVVNQSIMCGTPVVAFEMGVALDLVVKGKTGYRAKLKDCDDLAQGIKYILELNDSEYKQLSMNCIEIGLKLCHPQEQAARFIEIFEANKKKENDNKLS